MTFKQKSLQPAFAFWSKARLFGLLWISCIAFADPPLRAQPTALSAAGLVTSLRLLAGSGLTHGTYEAGVEIAMAPGSHTYWKMPGDAGVPPVFSFVGSQNVAAATVDFPVPKRITEEGLQAFGYTGTVIFPVAVTPIDSAKPAVLNADVTYAVCNKICIPAHGAAKVTLAPESGGNGAADVAAALKRVPAPMTPAQRADLEIRPDDGSPKPTWTLTWTGATPVEDIFADAPEGFYFDTRKRGPATWTLTAAQTVATPTAKPVPVTLTLARMDGGLRVTEFLDAATATR